MKWSSLAAVWRKVSLSRLSRSRLSSKALSERLMFFSGLSAIRVMKMYQISFAIFRPALALLYSLMEKSFAINLTMAEAALKCISKQLNQHRNLIA